MIHVATIEFNLLAVSRDSGMTSQSVEYVGLGAIHAGRNGDVELEPSDFRLPRKKDMQKISGLVENLEGKKWMGVGSGTDERRKIHSGPSVVKPPYTLLVTNQVAHQVIGAALPPIQIRTH